MKELLPLNENVLLDITEDSAEQKTASGIIIPDSAKQKQKFAKVVAIGNIEKPQIKIGDTVYYKEFSGTETDVDDKKFLIIAYDDLLAKVVETEKI